MTRANQAIARRHFLVGFADLRVKLDIARVDDPLAAPLDQELRSTNNVACRVGRQPGAMKIHGLPVVQTLQFPRRAHILRPAEAVNAKTGVCGGHVAMQAPCVIAMAMRKPRVHTAVLRIQPEVDLRQINTPRCEINLHRFRFLNAMIR